MPADEKRSASTAPPAAGADAVPPGEWERRRQDLGERLATRRVNQPKVSEKGSPTMQGMAQGMRLGSEFVGGVLVGGGIGFLIDHFAGTMPIALIIFLMLGFAAGVLNVVRSVQGDKSRSVTMANTESSKSATSDGPGGA
ncbi:AtpZ/AtpI family protein [Consotaella salsifontis]|uniref:ATP synthase protein I n=1 Tax=Consotaella salsifontis TaxID=1365950 RepID=A0A1T4N1L4_9HYPH|nr:AtpZ/AtpI family protein [Consotaella salsifontis]SJZ73014.1 ATP synthase protein I [Consotaella salsifontis]